MLEFKVLRMTVDGKKLYEEFLMFQTDAIADKWAKGKNAENAGSIVDMVAVESDYEY